MKKHLITGITGQDGLFLVKKILEEEENPLIFGISRNVDGINFYKNLKSLEIENIENVKLFNLNLIDSLETSYFIKEHSPDNIYNLTGPSSPYESIQNPEKYIQIETIFDNLTDALIENKHFANFYQASSSEMFENADRTKLNELSKFNPKSPYAKYKFRNHLKVLELRRQFDWNISSGIMFNHESEFRKEKYLFKKVINSALKIKNKQLEKLEVGSLDYVRDWSFAGDISEAIYKISNHGKSDSYVIGSGIENSIGDLISIVFEYFNLDMEKKVHVNPSILRKGDPDYIISDPSKIKNELDWKTSLNFNETVLRCIEL